MSYFSLVLGELVPKRIAMHNPEKVSFAVVGMLGFIKAISRPFVAVLSVSTNLLLRLFGIDPNKEEKAVTEDEILLLVDAGEETGAIEENQAEMINNIFEFDDIDVSDVMTHRTDMIAVEDTDTLEDVVNLSIEHGYSRIPVYHEDQDNIIGVIYIKDLLKYVGSSVPENFSAASLMREAMFIPESKKCGDLFSEMTEKHLQMVVVSDEYGGVAGIVTMEDVIETMLGQEIVDETDEVVDMQEYAKEQWEKAQKEIEKVED